MYIYKGHGRGLIPQTPPGYTTACVPLGQVREPDTARKRYVVTTKKCLKNNRPFIYVISALQF